MELSNRERSVKELRDLNAKLVMALMGLVVGLLLVTIKLFFQSEIIVERTAGMPTGSVIQKSAWDKKAQLATLLDVTNAIANINPANAEYQKQLLQVFLAPASYTRIASEIDDRAKKLADQRELGSYYFIWKAFDYDEALDRFFVRGDIHTVNAAKDTAEPWVFEYETHVDNYHLVVDKVSSYHGDRAHDSAWLKEQNK
jgi:conjugal transfer pilus assembly protein TraE